jgi:AraC family transcriptional regulator
MSNIASMFQAVEVIERNLKAEVTIADIADAVAYSLYHFCRTFNRVVHHSPYDYLMRRRLSESARELVETDRRIIDIAFDYRFNSHETYSRAFKRMFGTQPSQWKRQGRVDRRFLMSRLTLGHIRHRNRGGHLKPVLEEKEGFWVAGVMTLVGEDQTAVPRLWEMLARELETVEGMVEPESFYGIVYYPNDWESRGRFYMAAVEIERPAVAGPAFVVKAIPPSRYARFVRPGSREELRFTLDYIYHTWLPQSGESLAYPLEIECYGQSLGDPGSDESEREIYVPVG